MNTENREIQTSTEIKKCFLFEVYKCNCDKLARISPINRVLLHGPMLRNERENSSINPKEFRIATAQMMILKVATDESGEKCRGQIMRYLISKVTT